MINIQKSYPVSQNQGEQISINGNGKIYIIHDPSHTHPYIHGSSKLESGLGFGWKFSRFGYEIPRKLPSLILKSCTTTSVSLPINQHSIISAVLIQVNPKFMILRIIPSKNGRHRTFNYSYMPIFQVQRQEIVFSQPCTLHVSFDHLYIIFDRYKSRESNMLYYRQGYTTFIEDNLSTLSFKLQPWLTDL